MYQLVCPNAVKNIKTGKAISTFFVYKTLEEALEHKKACDDFAEATGRKSTAYIIKLDEDEKHTNL